MRNTCHRVGLVTEGFMLLTHNVLERYCKETGGRTTDRGPPNCDDVTMLKIGGQL